jgi:hypothetical protein
VAALAGEIVRLSRQFGILTEYTSFFAREGMVLGGPGAEVARVRRELDAKALRVRSGAGSVSQDANRAGRKSAGWVDPRNTFLGDDLRPVELGGVNQVGDLAFHRRGGRWVDARLLDATGGAGLRALVPGSAEHARLADQLAREGRQGALVLRGEVVVLVDGTPVLLVNP